MSGTRSATRRKNERIAALLADAVEGRYRAVEVVIDNVWRGHRVRHPVQLNPHGLPPELVVSILGDFVAETQSPPREVRNYADWLVASYGRTFAETFPMTYGRKYHTTEPENMTTEWLGPRMYRPDLDELLRFEKTLMAMWHAIRTAGVTGDFRPNPSRMCDWCAHHAHCPTFGGTPPPYPGWPTVADHAEPAA